MAENAVPYRSRPIPSGSYLYTPFTHNLVYCESGAEIQILAGPEVVISDLVSLLNREAKLRNRKEKEKENG